MHAKIIECLVSDKLQVNRLIGIGCDGANAMVGRNRSVATLLQATMPNLVVFRCVCHSLHLVASKAVESLPVALEFLIRESHNWFSCSPKRTRTYQQLCAAMAEKTPIEIPGHCETIR
jgi:hypothetical protein